jgi:hypothetical protein
LARLQRDFLEAVLAPEAPADARLAVYHRSVRANRVGALAAAYPVVQRLVGEAFFGEAAARFADAFPSRSGDLHAYGREFAGFLSHYPHARAHAWLPDVARLEWAVHESKLAAQGGPFDYSALGRIAPDRLGEVRIGLRPCVRLVSSPHPILAIWEANQDGRDGTPGRLEGGERVLVRRDASFRVLPVAVDAAVWILLEAFAQAASLGQALAECERRGFAFESSLRALAALDALGGFALAPA